jgi:membrane protein DedA with SNARE-associated domain
MGITRAMVTGTATFLIAAGAVLLFATPTTSTHGLDPHLAGVILILAGAIGLALSLLFGRRLSWRRTGLVSMSAGRESRRVRKRKAAATAVVLAIMDDDERSPTPPAS